MKKDTWILLAAGVGLLALGGTGIAVSGILGNLSPAQIATYATNAGFAGSNLVTAVAIALAESGGNPNAHGDTTIGTGTGSFGLWQIYSDAHPEYGPDFTILYDPQTNAGAAYAISGGGTNFYPWTTFNNKAYLTFLPQVNSALGVA